LRPGRAFLRLLATVRPGLCPELTRRSSVLPRLPIIALAALRILPRVVAIDTLWACGPELLTVLLLCHFGEPRAVNFLVRRNLR
jgi:hypothetical protein